MTIAAQIIAAASAAKIISGHNGPAYQRYRQLFDRDEQPLAFENWPLEAQRAARESRLPTWLLGKPQVVTYTTYGITEEGTVGETLETEDHQYQYEAEAPGWYCQQDLMIEVTCSPQ